MEALRTRLSSSPLTPFAPLCPGHDPEGAPASPAQRTVSLLARLGGLPPRAAILEGPVPGCCSPPGHPVGVHSPAPAYSQGLGVRATWGFPPLTDSPTAVWSLWVWPWARDRGRVSGPQAKVVGAWSSAYPRGAPWCGRVRFPGLRLLGCEVELESGPGQRLMSHVLGPHV